MALHKVCDLSRDANESPPELGTMTSIILSRRISILALLAAFYKVVAAGITDYVSNSKAASYAISQERKHRTNSS
jgi:hypothetical protein